MIDKEKSAKTVIVHGTSEGKLFIKEEEFFNNLNVRTILKKLLNSTAYKAIKNNRARV